MFNSVFEDVNDNECVSDEYIQDKYIEYLNDYWDYLAEWDYRYMEDNY